jgi:MFS family permease
LQVAALFMVVLGLWTPYFYIATYGIEHGMSVRLANYLFALINAGSFIGRVSGGFLAGWVGQFNVITASCYISAILIFAWLGVTSTAGLIVLAILFGASSGIIIALMMSTIAHTADHPSKVGKADSAVLCTAPNSASHQLTMTQIGTYIGQSTFVVGFAGLAGTPITGALISQHGFSAGITFSAAVILVGAVLITGARYSFAPNKLNA